MGLDQYGLARKKGKEDTLLMQWRKHANLEGWMHRLYERKGGIGDFNCVELYLTKADILRLQESYMNLKKAEGFFWGVSEPSDDKATASFIEKALEYLDADYDIIYYSWW